MVTVALWSKYPTYYVEGKIEPKLRERGISVIKRLSTQTKEVDLSQVDVVLCMHEMASHAEVERLRIIANSNSKRVFVLSRKEAFWDRDLSKLEQFKMPAPKAIPDSKVEAFCTKYIELKKQGMNHEQMLPSLQEFWRNGKLTNSSQLSQYMRNLLSGERAPKFFREFSEQLAKEKREQKIAHEQVMENLAVESRNGTATATATTHDLPVVDIEAKIEAKSESKSELEIYEELYKEEMQALIKKNDEFQADLKLQQAQQAQDGQASRLIRVVGNVVESVSLGINTKEVAFDRIAEFCVKMRG